MIEALRVMGSLQNMNVECRLPKFSDENSMNPLEFLESIEQFFLLRNISNNKKVSLLPMTLEGRAQLWYGLQNPFQTYEAFKDAFTSEFYSIPIQVQKKSEWSVERFSGNDGNLQTYFYKKLKASTYIRPPIIEYERNYTIIQQYPFYVRQALASVDPSDTNTVARTLAGLDAVHVEKVRSANRRQAYQNNSQQTLEVSKLSAQSSNVNTRRGHTRGRGRSTYSNYNRNNSCNECSHNMNFDRSSNITAQNDNYNQNMNNPVAMLPDTSIPPPNYNNSNFQVTHSQNSHNNINM